MTCEAARAAAEAARAPEAAEVFHQEALDVCERLDAALLSGDAFEHEGALALLEEYMSRWWRVIRERAPSPYLPPPDLVHRRLGTLVGLLRSGKIIRGGLTPEEMRQWARQTENIMKGTAPEAAEEKDPLLL